MRIAIVGTGYVGLVSGACLAHVGHHVTCVDIDAEKVAQINRGEPPIYEKGLADLLKGLTGTRLFATTDLAAAVEGSELSLIAVGTPFDGENIDLSYIRTVALQIGAALKEKDGYHTVVVKSTVVPGTTENVVLPLLEEASGKRAGADFGVGMNPEFLKEGDAIDDFMHPDRIVLGGIDAASLDALETLYAAFPDIAKIRTTPRTAEMIKYTANSLLATLISFSNEMGNLCAATGGIDVTEVMKGVHLDKRFSPILEGGERVRPGSLTYIEAGCGFGGSCFPKDVKALVSYGRAKKQPMSVLSAVIETNTAQPARMIEMAKRHHPSLNGVNVAVLGLAFKPGTDDIRESASLAVIDALLAEGAVVAGFDPIARAETERYLGADAIAYADTVEDAIAEAEVIMLMTSWPEFRDLPALLADRAPAPVLIDGRRLIPKDAVQRYEGIGLS